MAAVCDWPVVITWHGALSVRLMRLHVRLSCMCLDVCVVEHLLGSQVIMSTVKLGSATGLFGIFLVQEH